MTQTISKKPKLRFKQADGTEYPDWQTKRLKDIGDIITGNTPSMKQKEYYENGIYNWATAQDFTHKYIENTIVKLSESGKQKARILPKGSILVTCIASIGLNAILKKDSAFNQQINGLTPYNDYNGEFIYYLIDYNVPTIKKFSNQTAVPIINKTDFGLLKFLLPTDKDEQAKIAKFLSIIDKRIELLQAKYDNLQKYKTGILQKIFTQQIRFKHPNGKNYPDWQSVRLCDVCDNIGGTSLEKFMDKELGTYKVISIGNYSTDGKFSDDSNRIILNEKTVTKLLNKNDLVMVLNDKTKTGDIIGSTILIDKDNTYIYNQRSERLICKNNVVPEFLWWTLNAPLGRKKIFALSQGGTQIYVNFSAVRNVNISLPELAEQKQIANFLSAIDEKITKTKNQITATKSFKQGLLQQMFI